MVNTSAILHFVELTYLRLSNGRTEIFVVVYGIEDVDVSVDLNVSASHWRSHASFGVKYLSFVARADVPITRCIVPKVPTLAKRAFQRQQWRRRRRLGNLVSPWKSLLVTAAGGN